MQPPPPPYPPPPYPQPPYAQPPYTQPPYAQPVAPSVPATRVRRRARFWSAAETLALGAGLVPFVASAARSTVETVNGKVVRFEYSDGVALACGVVAILFALAVAGRIWSTAPAMRPLRALLVVGLLGLGVVQLLRGTGAFQSPRIASLDRNPAMDEVVKRDADRAAAAAQADLNARARAALEHWQAGEAGELIFIGRPSAP